MDNGAGSTNKHPIFDIGRLYDSCGDDEETIHEVITDFLEVSPRGIGLLARAIAIDDHRAIYYESHTLKGSSFTIGAELLGHICEEIELRARHAEAYDYPAALKCLQCAWLDLQPVLEEQIK